ncbi:NAD(P)-binding protein [Favolaschia claudopus]|uniref:NAD(P)-binding protein n=1 Tax=Favolaschia claudopus TaxID=2862362 RepID=A0AAW0C0M3_9AGAR
MSSAKGVAFVTGAAQGIGRSIALRLAADGFDVAVNDITAKSAELDTLVDEIKQKGRKSSKHAGDVSNDETVRKMIEAVVGEHGRLDVMVANAGIAGPFGKKLIEVSAEQFDRVMQVNTRSMFLCYKYAGLQMIKQGGGGRIIGACSVTGKKAMQTQAAYSASKFAVRGLTQAAALELGEHGITVNAYAPGAIDTPMLRGTATSQEESDAMTEMFKKMSPLGMLGTPEDIASLASFLASKESHFITGQTISSNGGIFFD